MTSVFTKSALGFTLVELIITICILTTVSIIAVPLFQKIRSTQESKTVTQLLLTTLKDARTAAVLYRSNVTLCPSSDGVTCQTNWSHSFIVFVDNNHDLQVNHQDKIIHFIHLNTKYGNVTWKSKSPNQYVTFRANTGNLGGSMGSFRYCSTYSTAHQKIAIGLLGLPRIAKPEGC